jgi:uncharacterized protein (TIGR02284 family)
VTEIGHEIRTLNGLIASTFDSIDGFTVAAENAKDERLGEMFSAHARERSVVVRSLQAEVRRLGGDAEGQGTLLAGLHRNFFSLKAAVIRNDLRAILGEVERGEDRLEAMFERALADDSLPRQVKAVIRAGFASVREGYGQMRDLEHELAIAA